ncbi:MAG: hypothetical protein QNK18_14970 [Gammaproteobacteria bacterium]|nr:hypothetical protein [Gammaproteobacteria bacterium]
MASTAVPYTYVVLHTKGEHGAEVLVVKRRLIQRWTDGRPSNPVIPQWAGQWGVICAQAEKPEPTQEIAYAAFLAQTGVNLSDSTVAKKYQITATEAKTLQDADYNPVPVFYIACQPTGMQALRKYIQSNIEAQEIQNGVLETTAVKRVSEAETLIGPVAPPPRGWKKFVIAHYYGGKPPPLNPPIDAQTSLMAARSAKPPTGFGVAIKNIPQGDVTPQPPVGTPILTTVTIVNTTPADLWLSATVASEGDWGSTVNRPDANIGRGARGTPTLAGFARLMANEEILSTAKSACYTVRVGLQAPYDAPDRTAISFVVDQTEARLGDASESSTRSLDVQGDSTGTWAVFQVGESTTTEVRGLSLYLLTPHGS